VFFFTPILAAIIGSVIFALVQGGLIVLTGSMSKELAANTITSSLGFVAIGCISGFNWDKFVQKLQELSSMLHKSAAPTPEAPNQ